VDDGYKKAVTKALNQAMLYQEIKIGQNWTLPLMNGPDVAWIPLTSFLTEERVLKQNPNTSAPNPFHGALFEAKSLYEQFHGTKHNIEFIFASIGFPSVGLIICLLALAALTLFKRFTLALVLSALTVLLQTVYFVFRIYISERAPVTNMYETVVFSGYSALILAMFLWHFKKEKVYLYMGLGYNVMCLMMTNFAHGMLSPGISPLVPVLRDNFWLSTHVTVVIMSYGAYALSWILANTVLFKKRFGTLTSRDELYYSDIIYTCIKWGSVLIAAGIILGGVWADYSWGRFWGWDPKETWSLIVFCLYIAILHGRYTNWIPTHRFVVFSAAAFMSVMMCWFGVNYILASGLHSYGFSEGGALFLGSFFLIQTVFIIMTIPFMKSDTSKTQTA
jgi:ABC-type transport system involved in cytochrome c biogenesis permease subunit